MIEWVTLALALVQLIASLLDARRATQPARDRARQDANYDRDVQHHTQAAATGDAATLTMDFEAERQAAIRRGDFDPSPPGSLP